MYFFSSELCSAFPPDLLSGRARICDIINIYFCFYVVSQSVIIRIYVFSPKPPTAAQSQDIAETSSSRLPIPAVNLTLEHQIIYCQTHRKKKGWKEEYRDGLRFFTEHAHAHTIYSLFLLQYNYTIQMSHNNIYHIL